MKFERKHYIYIILAILLSLITIDGTETIINYNNYTNGSSNGSFYTDINMNENNITEVTEMRNNGTLYTPYINLGSSKIELGTKFLGSPLRMWDLQITGMNAYYNLNMNNKSLLNCLNCANKTELNEKVNKSGDIITGKITFNSSDPILFDSRNTITKIIDSTGGITFNSALNLFVRNYTTSTNLTAQLGIARLNLNMSEGSGLCLDGCGASTLIQLIDNRGTRTVGKFAFQKINDSLNTTKVAFYVRASTADSSAGTLAFEATPDNFTVPSKNGTGYEFACWDENGNLIRSSVSCDLI